MSSNVHSFHIPVMGTAFSIDTPFKVAHYGINSVISIGDDMLLERIRKMYCRKFDLPYSEIDDNSDDYRARRITSYLNLIKNLVERKFNELKSSGLNAGEEIKRFLQMLPDGSVIKKQFHDMVSAGTSGQRVLQWLNEHLSAGSIDVNIMTKLDKPNFTKGEQMPIEFNDAHAALRGFAMSELSSSIIFSAGMNPRLFSYIQQFLDFYPDKDSRIKKKIVLKVSDYRSALIQGRFLAKKGLWVSEYRIESGLNCGGHAFATNGYVMGPILAEFRDHREELYQLLHSQVSKAWVEKGHIIPDTRLPFRVTAQGGVGTAEEHQFLLDHYHLDSVGWGTPFLLVPEVTNVDSETRNMLVAAKENDLYLSGISPLGVPFNSLRGNTKDEEKLRNIEKGRPGSPCPKKLLSSNTEFTDEPICTASRQYQNLKLKELDTLNLSKADYKSQQEKIMVKSCLCVGLGNAALMVNDIISKKDGFGVSICPGPNLAYFSKELRLDDMIDHIYGRKNVISRSDRPHMFVNELGMYMDYFRDMIKNSGLEINPKQLKNLLIFSENLKSGIAYYQDLFEGLKEYFGSVKGRIFQKLDHHLEQLNVLVREIEELALEPA